MKKELALIPHGEKLLYDRIKNYKTVSSFDSRADFCFFEKNAENDEFGFTSHDCHVYFSLPSLKFAFFHTKDCLAFALSVCKELNMTDSQIKSSVEAIDFSLFSNTVIIMTTNAGSEKSNSVSGFSIDRHEQAAERVDKALSKFLRPEFINRIDEVITFRHLTVDDFAKIAKIMLTKMRDHLAEKDIKLVWSDDVLEFIARESFSDKYGARNMRRYIEKNVEDAVANLIIDAFPSSLSAVSVKVDNGALKFDSM
jgi:hypothetical protein